MCARLSQSKSLLVSVVCLCLCLRLIVNKIFSEMNAVLKDNGSSPIIRNFFIPSRNRDISASNKPEKSSLSVSPLQGQTKFNAAAMLRSVQVRL